MDETKIATRTETKRALVDAGAHLPPHVYAAVRAHLRVDDLFPVTNAELEAAVRDVQSIRLG